MANENFGIKRNEKIDPNSKEASLTVVLENRDGSAKSPEEVESFINKYAPFFISTEPGQFKRMELNVLQALQAWSDTLLGDERYKKLEQLNGYFREKIGKKEDTEKIEQKTLTADNGAKYEEDDDRNIYLYDEPDFPNS